MKGPNLQTAKSWMGDTMTGVTLGGVVRDPGSATLTATIEGLIILLKSSTSGKESNEWRIAEVAKAFTASKDTYVGVGSAGTLFYDENTVAAAKPTQAYFETTYGAGAQLIAKVTTDGTRVIAGGVTDMRQFSGTEVLSDTSNQSFLTAAQGSFYFIAPHNLRVLKGQGTVVTTLGAVDTGTITLARGVNDVYTNMTGGVATFAISAAVGTRAACLPSDNNIVAAGQVVRITTLKTTGTGVVTWQLLFERIA